LAIVPRLTSMQGTKRQEWDEYRVLVTPWEIDRFLSVL